jgi:hypothetical protein
MPRKKTPSPEPPEAGKPFDPLVLDKTVIAIPLLEKIRQENEGKAERAIYSLIIDLKPRISERPRRSTGLGYSECQKR